MTETQETEYVRKFQLYNDKSTVSECLNEFSLDPKFSYYWGNRTFRFCPKR